MTVLQGLTANGSDLYAAWKGEPNDERIFFSVFKGSGGWSNAVTIPGHSSAGPALGLFNGTLYAAWKGEWSDPRLFFTRYDGTSWHRQTQIPDAYSDVGPALCQFGSSLIAVWKTVFDQTLWYASFDGTAWTVPAQIIGAGSAYGPSLAVSNGRLYAAWRGEGNDKGLYFASYDGEGWTSQTEIAGAASKIGPSLADVGGVLYAVWRGARADQRLWYSTFDGCKWAPHATLASARSSIGAAITAYQGQLHAMWKGENADVNLYTGSLDGATWNILPHGVPGNTGPDSVALLAPPAGGASNYVFSDSQGAALTGTTLNVIVTQDIIPGKSEAYAFQFTCENAQPTSGEQTLVRQQFSLAAGQNKLWLRYKAYRAQDIPARPFIEWESRPEHGRNATNGAMTLPVSDNRLPKFWQLSIALVTDAANNVTGFTYTIVQPGGAGLISPEITLQDLNPHVTQANLAPIHHCAATLVKTSGSGAAGFSAGQGIMLCSTDNNLVAAPPAGAPAGTTGRSGNISYTTLPPFYPNGEFYQFFGVGAPDHRPGRTIREDEAASVAFAGLLRCKIPGHRLHLRLAQ